MLAEARSHVVRYTPAEALEADVLLVGLRSVDERERAETLVQLGVDAGDLDGGFEAWAAAGLPVE